MSDTSEQIYDFLRTHHIAYVQYEHVPVFTVDEADAVTGSIEGVSAKTLLVCGEKTKQFYLVSLEGHKRMDQKRIKELLGERVRFSNPDDLERVLRVTPGSVSPLGLIFDTENEIASYIIDQEILDSQYVTWHPNINTQTLQITQSMNKKFLECLGHRILTY